MATTNLVEPVVRFNPCRPFLDLLPTALPGRAVPQTQSPPSPQNPRAVSLSPTSRQTNYGDLHRRSLSGPAGPDEAYHVNHDAMRCLTKADLYGIVHTVSLATVCPNRGGD
jgi:hypothetical protein